MGHTNLCTDEEPGTQGLVYRIQTQTQTAEPPSLVDFPALGVGRVYLAAFTSMTPNSSSDKPRTTLEESPYPKPGLIPFPLLRNPRLSIVLWRNTRRICSVPGVFALKIHVVVHGWGKDSLGPQDTPAITTPRALLTCQEATTSAEHWMEGRRPLWAELGLGWNSPEMGLQPSRLPM